MIEICEHFLFPNQETIKISRPENCGNLELTHEELIKQFSASELHPIDLKWC